MKYPNIYPEDLTIDLASRFNLSRFGDGELRIAIGKDCISQRERFPKLVDELKEILHSGADNCLVCIPNVKAAPDHKKESWSNYLDLKYVSLYGMENYGSSFVTRPDSAPWIDRPDYWDKIRRLWADKDVVLVVGDKKSITTEMIGNEARSIREVHAPRQNAYREIDRIEEEIGQHNGVVLMCLGVTATVLAWRLAKRGVHAIDLGHIGMFMRHAGAYRYTSKDLVTPSYKKQLERLHKTTKWGNDGAKHAAAVKDLVEKIKPDTILDYGCGKGALAEALKPVRCMGYDPGIPGKDQPPKPADLVICTDVLEHIEPDRLETVLKHIWNLTGKAAYLVIATRPAKARLPDGRNAHLIIQNEDWWKDKIRSMNFGIIDIDENPGREVKMLVVKG